MTADPARAAVWSRQYRDLRLAQSAVACSEHTVRDLRSRDDRLGRAEERT